MPIYYFVLKSDRDSTVDEHGEDLPDAGAARVYAETVARELMQSRELGTRFWRIHVCDDYLHPLFEVCFSEVDKTIDHLPLAWRGTINAICRRMGRLNDSIAQVQSTMADMRKTLNDANRVLTSIREGSSD